MKKILVYSLLIAGITLPQSANAFSWSNINNQAKNIKQKVIETRYSPVSETSTIKVLNQLKNELNATDTVAQNSFLSIASALSSKDEADNITTKLNSILKDSMLSDTYRTNEVNSLISSFTSSMLANQGYVISAIAGMSNSQKLQLLNNFKSLAKCGYKYSDIAAQYMKIASVMSLTSSEYPSSAISANNLKDNAESLKNSVKTINDLITQTSAISKMAGFNSIGSILNLIK